MKFEELTRDEIYRVLAHVPASVHNILKVDDVVLAGGVIRDTLAGLPVKDIDIFCHSEAQAERLALRTSSFIRRTTFAFTAPLKGELPVQFVFYKDFVDAKDLVRQFDFRACCAGIYWRCDIYREVGLSKPNGWEGIAVEGFRQDCQERVLRFMSQKKDENKLTALRRALDFARKGWTISNEELTAIVTHFEPGLEVERVKRSFRPAYGRI